VRYAQLHAELSESQRRESIGTLAGSIAHDFNNILTGIQGELSMLAIELNDDARSCASIRDIVKLVDSGADLARQLLSLTHRAPPVVTALDLAGVVSRTSVLFGHTRKEIEIQLDLAPGLQAVLMDRTPMEQVLLNLLVNAAQAMPRGGQLFLHAENVELAESDVAPSGARPGRFVRLDVKDTGVGMNSATQARIFEPFFTTKAPGQGTGLGLASVQRIVKKQGGFISVQSEIGKGSTFSVFLVATDLPTPDQKTPAAVILRGNGTILVVDDEQYLVKMLKRLLESIGYDVLTASSGQAAIEIIRQQGLGISLVILDMVMPKMDGSQTFDLLRTIAPGIKVLVSSGFSFEGHVQDMLARGCKGFIQKPYNVASLSVLLRSTLSA
jgi:two-component system cell cycle sensor histidine kinase/response regulator CckA